MFEIGINLAKKFGAFLKSVRRPASRRRTIDALYALDDRTLKDIGITRAGILSPSST